MPYQRIDDSSIYIYGNDARTCQPHVVREVGVRVFGVKGELKLQFENILALFIQGDRDEVGIELLPAGSFCLDADAVDRVSDDSSEVGDFLPIAAGFEIKELVLGLIIKFFILWMIDDTVM
jgi:hypothetical protein